MNEISVILVLFYLIAGFASWGLWKHGPRPAVVILFPLHALTFACADALNRDPRRWKTLFVGLALFACLALLGGPIAALIALGVTALAVGWPGEGKGPQS